MVTIPAGIVPPFGYFLIANFAETDALSRLAVTPDLVTTTVELDGKDVQYKLVDGFGVVHDIADDAMGPPLKGKGFKDFVAMERNDPPGDGTLGTNWHDATVQVNFDSPLPNPGVPLGTPKSGNVP